MRCDEAADLIGPYTDDALPEETRRRVEAHLMGCQGCAWDAQTQTITRSRLRGETREIVASDAFRARTLARLHADNPHCAPGEAIAADPAQYQLPIRI